MISYGFKLFKVQLRKRDGHKDAPFLVQKSDGTAQWRFSDYFEDLLNSRANKREQGTPHNPIDVEEIFDAEEKTRAEKKEEARLEARATKPVFFVTAARKSNSHVFFEVRYGAPADHDVATSVEDPNEDKQIAGLRPTRPYRAFLIVPDSTSAEDFGILAVETIGRACPSAYIQSWTRWWASSAAKEKLEASDGNEEVPWWKMRLTAVGDDSTFMAFINRADPSEIRLTYQDGSPGSEIKLTAGVGTDVAKRSLRKQIKDWKKAEAAGEEYSVSDAANSVAALLGEEVEALAFDDVAIQLQDDELGSRTITPDNLSEVFTYRFSQDTVPTLDEFRGAVRHAITRVKLPYKPQYDWTGWPAARR